MATPHDNVAGWLNAIISSSDDAIISKTLDGVIRSWNGAAERIFGYSAEEAVGKHIFLIIPDERRAEEEVVLGKIRKGETVDHFETVRRRKDGQMVHISLTVSPIKDPHGNIIGASKVARDIGDQVRARKALAESAELLRAADQRKDQFIAILAHELRNPLSAIGLGVELLQRAEIQDPKARFAVPAIRRQTEQLKRLAADLLDSARATHGKLILQQRPMNLLEMARAVAADFAPRAADAVIGVEGEPMWLDGDPARVQQMIENLLENAIKYGGHTISIEVGRAGPLARLAVQDDGQGIAPDFLPKLFESFVQGEQPLDREQRGLGLGLALVKQLAELHGGAVTAQSDGVGRGSRFTLSFPAIVRPTFVSAGGDYSAAARRRILVVEDEADSREFLRLLLESEGHEVQLAANGADGLKQVALFRPDVALVDIAMPGMDGFEVARQVRAMAGGRAIRLVAVTGFGDERHRSLAREAGFDQHITKPVSYDQLRRVFGA